MTSLYFDNVKHLRLEKSQLEKKLVVTITIKGRQATIQADPLHEYEAILVLEALQFGFSAKQALQLQQEDMIFRTIPIRSFTRRKNLRDVKARLIGTKGQTRRTLQEISGCSIIIKENSVGLLGPIDKVDDAQAALTSLIRGSKQGNVYHYLEQRNTQRKRDRYEQNLPKK